MSEDKYHGIRKALRLAMLTGQSVNVALNTGGASAKVEGVVQAVYERKFRIQLDPGESGDPRKTFGIRNVEYVEYS